MEKLTTRQEFILKAIKKLPIILSPIFVFDYFFGIITY